jgi:hypothetical protein
VNFSRSGFAVETSIYPAIGVRMKANLLCQSDLLGKLLRDSGLMPLIIEVRWGYTAESGARYRIGVEIKSLNDQQLERLHEMLRGHLARRAEKKIA